MRRALTIAAAVVVAAAAPAYADFTQQKVLTAADAAAGDLLGGVRVGGNTLVGVSSPHRNANGVVGAIYVFERSASGWAHATQTAKLTIPTAAGVPRTVAISNDGATIAVGATDATVDNKPNAGLVFIFAKPASGWADTSHPDAQLSASDPGRDDQFGFRIALSGDTLVASAPFHTVRNNINQGTAYVFVKPLAGWASGHETAKLTDGSGAGNDLFGVGLAMDGDTIVAGAPGHQVGDNSSQGEAFVFVKPSTGWATRAQDAKLASSRGVAGERFGSPLAISGDAVVAGIPDRKVGTHAGQGAVEVFVKQPQGWVTETQTADLIVSDGATDDHLGDTVSISGDRVLAGAPFHGGGRGSAYLFDRPGSAWTDTTETQALTVPDAPLFGSNVVLSGNVAFLATPLRSLGELSMAGGIYIFGQAPAITIDAPLDGARFTKGEAVPAAYSCAAGTSCTGPVAQGEPIDTSSAGTHTFTVEAVDGEGVSATKTVSYSIVAKDKPPPPPRAPSITALKQSHSVWRERGKRPVGTTFSFRLDQPAHVALRFARRGKPAGVVSVNAHTGTNRVRFQGRISRKRKLAPGRYTLRLTASNAAGKSAASRQLGFTIVRR